MARLRLTQNANGSSTWRMVAGTKEQVGAQLAEAVRDGRWPAMRFEGREEVVLNPASVLWVEDD